MPKLVARGNPPQPATKVMTLTSFKGVDITSSPIHVSLSRSPDAPNMMPDADGYPKKRPGYKLEHEYDGVINGAFAFAYEGIEKRIIHAGTKLYEGETLLYENMNDAKSTAVQLKGKLWILDGKTYIYYDGAKAGPVSEIATVPTVAISKEPGKDGAATSYKPINLLTGKRTDSFIITQENAAVTEFVLSFNELSSFIVKVEILNVSGAWIEKTEVADFAVDRPGGRVMFKAAPGKTPVTGEDNVKITYETEENKAESINNCKFSILYGVNGALDRIFMGGSEGEPNIDYWSEFNDPTYMGDMFYSVLGQEASPIMGYSVLNDNLVAHKNNEENGRNAFVRNGRLDDEGFAIFPIVGVLQGEGAIAQRSFASLNGEPVFLTARGIYALTPSDITGERYAQKRSEHINGELLKKEGLKNAACTVWGRFYVIAVDDTFYLLDGDQRSYEKRSPYSTYQYEAYYWTKIKATNVWVFEGELFFGTSEGKVFKFDNVDYSGSYTDNGAQIDCYWTTPLLNFDMWSRLKTVTGVWLTTQPYSKSDGRIYFATDKEYAKFVRNFQSDLFDFNDIDFDRWTFETLNRPRIIPTRRKAKKIKLFQVKIENKENTPFGIFSIDIEYKVIGKVKK